MPLNGSGGRLVAVLGEEDRHLGREQPGPRGDLVERARQRVDVAIVSVAARVSRLRGARLPRVRVVGEAEPREALEDAEAGRPGRSPRAGLAPAERPEAAVDAEHLAEEEARSQRGAKPSGFFALPSGDSSPISTRSSRVSAREQALRPGDQQVAVEVGCHRDHPDARHLLALRRQPAGLVGLVPDRPPGHTRQHGAAAVLVAVGAAVAPARGAHELAELLRARPERSAVRPCRGSVLWAQRGPAPVGLK